MAALSNQSQTGPTETTLSLLFNCDSAQGKVYRATNQSAPVTDEATIITNAIATGEVKDAVAGAMQFDLTGLTAGQRYYHDIVQDTQATGPTGYNYLEYSEDFANQWNNFSTLTFTTGQSDPLGGSNATVITAINTSGSANLRVGQSPQDTLSIEPWCMSVYAKAALSDDIALRPVNWFSSNSASYLALDTGTLGTPHPNITNHGRVDVGSGWYRYYVSFTPDIATGGIEIIIADGENIWLPKDGTNSLTIFGAQLNKGTQPDAYAQTTGTPITP